MRTPGGSVNRTARWALAVFATISLVAGAGCTPSGVKGPATSAPATASPAPSQPESETDDASWNSPDRAYVEALPVGRLVGTGDPERKAILDALRIVVERELDQPVEFEVYTLRIGADFAGFSGRPVTPSGKTIDYLQTRYAPAVEAGAFDDGVLALLQQVDGRWRTIECDIGATDYPGDYWLMQYKVPANLFQNE
jgi:hypothetical protein